MSKNNWEKHSDNIAEGLSKGPASAIWTFIKYLFPTLIVVGCIAVGCNFISGTIGGTAKVMQKELNPTELLRKYEWFKDASAQLDKKRADIQMYKNGMTNMKADYSGEKRKDWDRTDKEQFNQWNTELTGVKASYNSLAAEYNAQMSKINWRFTNAGMLPEGATETLPREFSQYTTN